MIQGPQLLIVLAIVLLLFGGSKLPKLARSLGEAQKEFRDGLKEGQEADSAANAKSTTPEGGGAATSGSTVTGSSAEPTPSAEPPKPDA